MSCFDGLAASLPGCSLGVLAAPGVVVGPVGEGEVDDWVDAGDGVDAESGADGDAPVWSPPQPARSEDDGGGARSKGEG